MVLDVIGIRDDEDQETLKKRIARHTINKPQRKKLKRKSSKGRLRGPRMHETRNLFDREEQIEVLLGEDSVRCSIIKQWTQHLQLEWKYSTFC